MSRFSITIGDKTFSSKKAALEFYKKIIDRYDFRERLSDEDAKSLIALGFKEMGTPEEVSGFADEIVADFFGDSVKARSRKLLGVMVDRHPDFRTTKCFYFFGEVDGEIQKDILATGWQSTVSRQICKHFLGLADFQFTTGLENLRLSSLKIGLCNVL